MSNPPPPPIRRPGSRGPLPGNGAGGRPELPPDKRKRNFGIGMKPEDWQRLDALRGDEARGDLVARLLAEEEKRRTEPRK